jgi:exodeoxyribonuclease VII large subunit
MQRFIYSVSELTKKIKEALETEFYDVDLRGEVSNFKRHSSGHLYFTLKDESAQLNAIIWRSVAQRLSFAMEDGLELRVKGHVEVYAPSGRYQLICDSAKPVGEGFLQQEFARLVEKLRLQGLFEEYHKQPLPRLPETIGVITSPTGAVIQDIRSILQRRYAAATVVLYPVRVQGEGAAEELIQAIKFFNALTPHSSLPKPDVLIVARGGGSLEDLWAFNDERLAREIYRSKIPIISAVGHETDFTIADFVADVRAGTPSMAAELVAPPSDQLLDSIQTTLRELSALLLADVERKALEIDAVVGSYAFNKPRRDIETALQRLDYAMERIERGLTEKFNARATAVRAALQTLDALGHERILKRGFALAFKHGNLVRSVNEIQRNDDIELKFFDGVVKLTAR